MRYVTYGRPLYRFPDKRWYCRPYSLLRADRPSSLHVPTSSRSQLIDASHDTVSHNIKKGACLPPPILSGRLLAGRHILGDRAA